MKYREVKKSMLVKHLMKDIANNADWLQFLLMFARFEYALKRSGYARSRYGYAEADWGSFINNIERDFYNNGSIELADAMNYLSDNPPYKQCLNNAKELEWRLPQANGNEITNRINNIKTVRNNLFHGGKYPTMPMKDPSRDEPLVRNCTIILKYLLRLSPKVQKHYYEELE